MSPSDVDQMRFVCCRNMPVFSFTKIMRSINISLFLYVKHRIQIRIDKKIFSKLCYHKTNISNNIRKVKLVKIYETFKKKQHRQFHVLKSATIVLGNRWPCSRNVTRLQRPRIMTLQRNGVLRLQLLLILGMCKVWLI